MYKEAPDYWKEEYAKLLLRGNCDDEETRKSLDLMKYDKMPPVLYKYRHFKQREESLADLLLDRITLVNPHDFNDPYDSILSVAISLDPEGMIDLTKKLGESKVLELSNKDLVQLEQMKASDQFIYDLGVFISRKINASISENDADGRGKAALGYVQEMQNYMSIAASKNIRDRYRMACFSEINDSILMWSHYADQHAGFCVEYDFKQLGPNDTLTHSLHPVRYTNTPFPFDASRVDQWPDFHGIYAAISKATDWAYEQEWRLIVLAQIVDEYLKDSAIYLPGLVKAVYLGAKIQDNHRKCMVALGRVKGFKIYQMKMNMSKFQLEPELIDIGEFFEKHGNLPEIE